MSFRENSLSAYVGSSEDGPNRPLDHSQNGCQIHPEIERRGEIFESLKKTIQKNVVNNDGLEEKDLNLLHWVIQTIFLVRLGCKNNSGQKKVNGGIDGFEEKIASFVRLSLNEKRDELTNALKNATDLNNSDLDLLHRVIQKLVEAPLEKSVK